MNSELKEKYFKYITHQTGDMDSIPMEITKCIRDETFFIKSTKSLFAYEKTREEKEPLIGKNGNLTGKELDRILYRRMKNDSAKAKERRACEEKALERKKKNEEIVIKKKKAEEDNVRYRGKTKTPLPLYTANDIKTEKVLRPLYMEDCFLEEGLNYILSFEKALNMPVKHYKYELFDLFEDELSKNKEKLSKEIELHRLFIAILFLLFNEAIDLYNKENKLTPLIYKYLLRITKCYEIVNDLRFPDDDEIKRRKKSLVLKRNSESSRNKRNKEMFEKKKIFFHAWKELSIEKRDDLATSVMREIISNFEKEKKGFEIPFSQERTFEKYISEFQKQYQLVLKAYPLLKASHGLSKTDRYMNLVERKILRGISLF